MPVVFRIGTDTPDYTADDLTGEGARITGGRWNRKGVPLINASESRALACLETAVHLSGGALPLNRYLVEIELPESTWQAREVFDRLTSIGWDARPAGKASMDWGSDWARDRRSLVAEVPSVLVPEESNLLINPLHPDIRLVRASKIRLFEYDGRLWM